MASCCKIVELLKKEDESCLRQMSNNGGQCQPKLFSLCFRKLFFHSVVFIYCTDIFLKQTRKYNLEIELATTSSKVTNKCWTFLYKSTI